MADERQERRERDGGAAGPSAGLIHGKPFDFKQWIDDHADLL